MKQSIVATSSNHAKIIVIHEASRECVWLRLVIHSIKERCGLKCDVKIPTILFEDNVACIPQLKGGFIKGDGTKHILPNYSSHMISRRMMILMCGKFVRVMIQQIHLPNIYRPQLLRR